MDGLGALKSSGRMEFFMKLRARYVLSTNIVFSLIFEYAFGQSVCARTHLHMRIGVFTRVLTWFEICNHSVACCNILLRTRTRVARINWFGWAYLSICVRCHFRLQFVQKLLKPPLIIVLWGGRWERGHLLACKHLNSTCPSIFL